jgi:hypothetical protein
MKGYERIHQRILQVAAAKKWELVGTAVLLVAAVMVGGTWLLLARICGGETCACKILTR